MPDYLDVQRSFWNVDSEEAAMFERVDLTGLSWEESTAQDLDLVLADYTIKDTDDILEVGCGVGRMLAALSGYPFRSAVGVDISHKMIEFAAQRLVDPRISLQVNDGRAISGLPSESFDFVFACHVFIHIADRPTLESYLSECFRVLRPGGVLRCNVRRWERTFAWSPGGILARLVTAVRRPSETKWTDGAPAELNGLQFTERDFRKALKRFDVTSVKPHDPCHLWVSARRP